MNYPLDKNKLPLNENGEIEDITGEGFPIWLIKCGFCDVVQLVERELMPKQCFNCRKGLGRDSIMVKFPNIESVDKRRLEV